MVIEMEGCRIGPVKIIGDIRRCNREALAEKAHHDEGKHLISTIADEDLFLREAVDVPDGLPKFEIVWVLIV